MSNTVRLGFLLFTMGALAVGGVLPAQAQAAPKPGAYAIVVDTSGSMVGYYQRRDPRPTMVQELVEALVTGVLQPGDALVVLSFDHQVHDLASDLIVLSSLDRKEALARIDGLDLRAQPGRGTVRQAAVGRATEALAVITSDRPELTEGTVLVITDADATVTPADGKMRQDHDRAQTLIDQGKLKRIATIPQGGLILEVWQVAQQAIVEGRMPSTSEVLAKVRTLLQRTVPGAPVQVTPGAADLERGQLTATAAGEWTPSADGATLQLPLSLGTEYRVLQYQGQVSAAGEVTGTAGNPTVSLDPPALMIAPEGQAAATLTVSGLPRLGWFAVRPVQPVLEGLRLGLSGHLTDDPTLFGVTDPEATARVSGGLWLPADGDLELADIPALPPVRPGYQGYWLLLALGLLALAVRWFTRPAALMLYYRTPGAPAVRAGLAAPGEGIGVPGVGVQVRREGKAPQVTVMAASGSTLLGVSDEPVMSEELCDRGTVLVRVRQADGSVSRVVLGLNRPQLPEVPPEKVMKQDDPLDVVDESSAADARRNDDDLFGPG